MTDEEKKLNEENRVLKAAAAIIKERIEAWEPKEDEKLAITVSGFGSFRAKLRKAGTRRNPQTGGTIKVDPKVVVTFKASNTWIKELNS